MGAIFLYSIVSGILLAVMYLVYKWMLAGENQHRYNRTILWCIYGASLILPAALPALLKLRHSPPAIAVGVEIGNPVITGVEAAPHSLLPAIFLMVYLAGVVLAMAATVLTAIKLVRIISRGDRLSIGEHRTLILTSASDRTAPFSWLNYIVMNRSDYESYGSVITMHETRHLELHHWLDLLMAQFVAIFQWYNPAAWLMREELKTVHEYQADEAVITSGAADPRQYQMLLIKKAVGARFPSLANSLNHSKLKKRVTMMYKSKSSMGRRFRALALLPAGAIALAAMNLPVVASALSSASDATLSINPDKVTKKSTSKQDDTISLVSDSSKPSIELRGSIPDNAEIRVNGKVVRKEDIANIPPSNVASMSVNKDDNGCIIDITLSDTDSDNGNASMMVITKAATGTDSDSSDSNKIFKEVEQQPEFPGGIQKMMQWLSEHIQYPESAKKAKQEGRVVVRFVVQKDGSIGDVEIVRGQTPDLDKEAIRVVKSFPRFTPGKSEGKPVAVWYALPIAFKLEK